MTDKATTITLRESTRARLEQLAISHSARERRRLSLGAMVVRLIEHWEATGDADCNPKSQVTDPTVPKTEPSPTTKDGKD